MKSILLSLVCLAVLAAAATPHQDLLAPVTREKYPDADQVTVFDSTRYTVDATGRCVRRHHLLVKALTEAGKKANSTHTEAYVTIYNKLEFELVRVISPSGKVIKVGKQAITDVPMPCWEGSKFVLPNVRLLTVTLPGLEVGSAIEIVVEDRVHNPPMEGHFDTWLMFEENDPIRLRVLEVDLPRSMNLRWQAFNGTVRAESTFREGRISYVWSKSDVAKMLPEPMMPPPEDVLTKLLVCTQPDWPTWSRWYDGLCRPQLVPDSALAAKTDELVTDQPDRNARIRALYYFVATQIRYLETELTGKNGGYQPEAVARTFDKRYGVCRDKAALLVAMLRHIGEPASMVLTNPMSRVEQELPVDQFNHAIVAIREANGEYLWLDPTVENAREFLTPYEMDKGVLVCDSVGRDLARTPIEPPEEYLTLTTIADTLDVEGTLRGGLVMKPQGLSELGLRSMFKMLPPEMRRQQLEQMVKMFGAAAQLDTFRLSDPNDLYRPLEMTMHFTVKDYATRSGDELRFSGAGSAAQLGRMGWALPERRFPISFMSTIGTRSESRTTLPPGYRVKLLPDTLNLNHPALAVRTELKVNGNQLVSAADFRVNVPVIPVADYAATRELIQRLEDNSRQQVVLTR